MFSIGYDFHLTNGDNGNVYQLMNYKDNSRSQVFTYDQLNRITSGKTSASSAWGTNYTIDAWGNLTQKTPMAGMLSGEHFVQSAFANNRLTGFSYDAAGNTTNDGLNTYVYNAENEIVSAAGVTYTYDGHGDRVKKSSGRLYWYGLSESDLSGNLTSEYIFFGGERVVRRDLPSGTVHYYFSDHLKSVSLVTSATGTIEDESDYTPWGEERPVTSTLADQHFKFNGKERDPETGFDDFGARLYSSAWSRWLIPDWSADPTPVPYGQMDNPQSLNLYAYVLNNPTTLPDLDGHTTPLANGANSADGGQSTQETPEKKREEEQLAAQTKGAKEPLTSITVLGKSVKITYARGLSATDQLTASKAIADSVDLLNKNASSLTKDEKNAIGNISSFSVVGSDTYLGATSRHGMTLSIGYIKASSSEWIGSMFGHEGQHHLNKGQYSGENRWKDEQSAGKMQLGIGNKIGFKDYERHTLEHWIDPKNKAAMQRHMEQGFRY